MYTIKYFCHHSGKVFDEVFNSILDAQKEWDRLDYKRSIYMLSSRPV